jgi:hypothetical protein
MIREGKREGESKKKGKKRRHSVSPDERLWWGWKGGGGGEAIRIASELPCMRRAMRAYFDFAGHLGNCGYVVSEWKFSVYK